MIIFSQREAADKVIPDFVFLLCAQILGFLIRNKKTLKGLILKGYNINCHNMLTTLKGLLLKGYNINCHNMLTTQLFSKMVPQVL